MTGNADGWVWVAVALTYGYCGPMRQAIGFARVPDAGRGVCCGGKRAAGGAAGVVDVSSREDWQFDPLRHFMEGLAVGRTVVRYDRVGTGMSDRDRPRQSFTPEFELATLCAVLDELGLERVTLMGIS